MRRQSFTLIEVLIAIAVLGLALATTLTICAQAKLDLIRAQERWADHHALEQAIEHYLLVDPRELEPPGDLLRGGYSANCDIEPIIDDLPEYANMPFNGWVLAAYTITIVNELDEVAGQKTVYKWLPEEDL
jgi:prepilin-type N-terminal cleavage/methylation domain-containing protein